MDSWVRTITTPFRKACNVFDSPRDKKCQDGHEHDNSLKLHGEVMACAYEDVQVMWSILDKSRSRELTPSSWCSSNRHSAPSRLDAN